MSLSTYAGNKILNLIFNATAFTPPTIYMSAHTGDPGLTGANEVSGGSYARVDISANFPSAASRAISNDVLIQFVTATASWGNVQYWGLWDALTDGNFIWGGTITDPQTINSTDTFHVSVGELDVAFS